MKLRPQQQRCLDDLWTWFGKHSDGNPIVNACVGAGKSVMIAALAERANAEFPGTRVLVLVHQKELLEQNIERIHRVWPGAPVGIYSAALKMKQLGMQVTFATIGSIYKRAYDLGRVDLVLADECHLINPNNAGIWRRFLTDLSRVCPHVRVIGWTGTPFRGNGVWLTAGKDALFTHIAASITMRELLDAGLLAPLVPAPTETKIDATGVRTSGGDYVVSELAKVADKAELVQATCREIVELAKHRKKWLVFAVNVEHAEHVDAELRSLGVPSAVVHGDTPPAERANKIADFRAGRLRCLVNVAVLTTGFDVPAVDFIALLRETQSPVLYVQIAGRGMRCNGANIEESIRNGKADCLWADFTNTTANMGPVDEVKGRMPSPKGAAEAPFRICPSCGSQNPTGRLECIDCGFKFPEPERIKHKTEASNAAVLSDQKAGANQAEVPITRVEYDLHMKPGAPDSMRVEYWNSIRVVAREWVLFNHDGNARRRAERWWMDRTHIDAIPRTTADALEWLAYDKRILKTPSALILAKNGKYHDIIEYIWGEHDSRHDEGGAGGVDQGAGGLPEAAEEGALELQQL